MLPLINQGEIRGGTDDVKRNPSVNNGEGRQKNTSHLSSVWPRCLRTSVGFYFVPLRAREEKKKSLPMGFGGETRSTVGRLRTSPTGNYYGEKAITSIAHPKNGMWFSVASGRKSSAWTRGKKRKLLFGRGGGTCLCGANREQLLVLEKSKDLKKIRRNTRKR